MTMSCYRGQYPPLIAYIENNIGIPVPNVMTDACVAFCTQGYLHMQRDFLISLELLLLLMAGAPAMFNSESLTASSISADRLVALFCDLAELQVNSGLQATRQSRSSRLQEERGREEFEGWDRPLAPDLAIKKMDFPKMEIHSNREILIWSM